MFKSRSLTQKASNSVTKFPTELEQTIAYISDNIIRAHDGRKCVDGRYLPTQASGMIARPGGDVGYVMALLAVNKKKGLDLTPEQCFNAVYKVVSKSKGFCLHTDHNSDPDSHTHIGLIGCGHLAKAATKGLAKDYDVDSEDMRRVVEYSRNLAEINNAVHMINLEGQHQEKGVLVIQSSNYTVNADNPKLGRMYFIYDKSRDEAFMQQLSEEMKIEGITPEELYREMRLESDVQLRATLHNLAKGLPVYTVEFGRTRRRPWKIPTFKVSFSGKVA
jgi:hypothetical protein